MVTKLKMVSDKIINWIGKYSFLMGFIMYINKRWSRAIDLFTFLVAPFAPDKNNYKQGNQVQLLRKSSTIKQGQASGMDTPHWPLKIWKSSRDIKKKFNTI